MLSKSCLNKIMNTLNIAQIGVGYWGPNLLRCFHSLERSRVRLAVDFKPERRMFVENNYPDIRTSDDINSVFDDDKVDAVIVATPPSSHFELTKQALQSGKHVLVEKPMAMCAAEVQQLGVLAKEQGLVLMVGHVFLYNDAVRYLKKLIDGGELGQIHYMYSARLNLGQVRPDVDVWWNLAPHDISIFLYLMDNQKVERVEVSGASYLQKSIDDVVFANIYFSHGIMANMHLSWLDPMKTRRMVVVGSRKMAVYDDVASDKIIIYDKGVEDIPRIGERMDFDNGKHPKINYRFGDIMLPHLKYREPLQQEANHFIDCIIEGKEPLTGWQHAHAVVDVLERGREAKAAIKPDFQRCEHDYKYK